MSESGTATLGMSGGPDVSEESEHDKNHEDDGNDQGNFHVVNRGADGDGAVDDDVQVQRGR